MKVAIMQPYFFPYLGYFQMVNAVDNFVFYDDVQFIKGGWINRNKILINKEPKYFSAQMLGASSNKLINAVGVNNNEKGIKKALSTISQNYSKAPFFDTVYALIEEVYQSQKPNIAELAALSIIKIAAYLGLKTKFHISSKLEFGHDTNNRVKRLIRICEGFDAKKYINAEGGKELYAKEQFARKGIDLVFLEGELPVYDQGTPAFYPALSIIDVLMHNSIDQVKTMLNEYKLT
jgi:hypothetical protein